MRSETRKKQLGEVFTPGPLVTKMLSQLPRETWIDHSKTFLDPTCGNGNFLVAVIKLKIAAGATPLQALSTTYGVDIMQDNVDECRERLLLITELTSNENRDPSWVAIVTKNIVCADTLTYDFTFQ